MNEVDLKHAILTSFCVGQMWLFKCQNQKILNYFCQQYYHQSSFPTQKHQKQSVQHMDKVGIFLFIFIDCTCHCLVFICNKTKLQILSWILIFMSQSYLQHWVSSFRCQAVMQQFSLSELLTSETQQLFSFLFFFKLDCVHQQKAISIIHASTDHGLCCRLRNDLVCKTHSEAGVTRGILWNCGGSYSVK